MFVRRGRGLGLALVLMGCSGSEPRVVVDPTDVGASPPDARIEPTRDATFPDATLPDAGQVKPDAEPNMTDMDAGVSVDAALPHDAGPQVPFGLTRYLTGNPADAVVTPAGGRLLMGGGRDVDAAMTWAQARSMGGDVVVLRTSGSDGYNDYLFSDIGGVDSVETLLVTSRTLAAHPYVADRVRLAEFIFLAGGNQATYVDYWRDTALQDALHEAAQRGAIIGGTSAGLAVLGEFGFAAQNGSVTTSDTLADPYHVRVTLSRDFIDLPGLDAIITDSHFAARDRMGRLVTFLARIMQDDWHLSPIGIGVNERTALVVAPSGEAEVLGRGQVYVVRPNQAPTVCQPQTPLTFEGLTVTALAEGDRMMLPSATSNLPSRSLDVADGVMRPADLY